MILIIGVDFELVGSSMRIYIERVYGLANNSMIVSGGKTTKLFSKQYIMGALTRTLYSTLDEFLGQPLYRSISQSVLLHRKFTIHQHQQQ